MKIPILSLMTFAPALAGVALSAVRPERTGVLRLTTLGVTLVVLLLAGAAYVGHDGPLVAYEDAAWMPRLGIRYTMGLDGISAAMVLLTALLMPLAVAASWHQPKGFLLALLFLETGMIGAFCALDLFLFYVFWEAMLLPMYLLIGIWGGPRRVTAAVKFIVYTIAGSVLMLAGILYCAWSAGTFSVLDLQRMLPADPRMTLATQQALFLAFALAFAIKVPVVPFHTWLPDAHVEAPTAGSVILAGVLLKMGAYGFLRFAIPFFPDAARSFAPALAALGALGVVYGAAMAMAQTDLKKLVAYSSVSHLGFVMLGIFSGTIEGAQGGVLQMVNHGLSTGALFLLVGVLYERTHRRGVDDFGGMARVMPAYAAIFLIVTLSSIGLPGLNGFVGEFLVLFGSFPMRRAATVAASLGVVLGAVYMLRMYRDVFWGPVTRPEREKVPDVGKGELAYLIPVTALIVLLGILPGLVLSRTERAVRDVVLKMETKTHADAERLDR
ncbi:MAG TPA: NADH-quinone oxidoreductase subunit M [Planctomycetota bacterium]|nr:NADH-quinone oxidoreductase subunit M [Planctomycetota bacterium]